MPYYWECISWKCRWMISNLHVADVTRCLPKPTADRGKSDCYLGKRQNIRNQMLKWTAASEQAWATWNQSVVQCCNTVVSWFALRLDSASDPVFHRIFGYCESYLAKTLNHQLSLFQNYAIYICRDAVTSGIRSDSQGAETEEAAEGGEESNISSDQPSLIWSVVSCIVGGIFFVLLALTLMYICFRSRIENRRKNFSNGIAAQRGSCRTSFIGSINIYIFKTTVVIVWEKSEHLRRSYKVSILVSVRKFEYTRRAATMTFPPKTVVSKNRTRHR